jgi:hypothetical protein
VLSVHLTVSILLFGLLLPKIAEADLGISFSTCWTGNTAVAVALEVEVSPADPSKQSILLWLGLEPTAPFCCPVLSEDCGWTCFVTIFDPEAPVFPEMYKQATTFVHKLQDNSKQTMTWRTEHHSLPETAVSLGASLGSVFTAAGCFAEAGLGMAIN